MKKMVSINALLLVMLLCFVSNANAQKRDLDLNLSANLLSINLGQMSVNQTKKVDLQLFVPQLPGADVDVNIQLTNSSYLELGSYVIIDSRNVLGGKVYDIEMDFHPLQSSTISTTMKIETDVEVLGGNLVTLNLDIPVTGSISN